MESITRHVDITVDVNNVGIILLFGSQHKKTKGQGSNVLCEIHKL